MLIFMNALNSLYMKTCVTSNPTVKERNEKLGLQTSQQT